MAKITITVEDSENGLVKIESSVPVATMYEMFDKQHPDFTPAHSLALKALSKLWAESRVKPAESKLIIPKFGG